MAFLSVVLSTVDIQEKVFRFVPYIGYLFMYSSIDLYLKVKLVIQGLIKVTCSRV